MLNYCANFNVNGGTVKFIHGLVVTFRMEQCICSHESGVWSQTGGVLQTNNESRMAGQWTVFISP